MPTRTRKKPSSPNAPSIDTIPPSHPPPPPLPPAPAPGAYANAAERQVEIVVDDDEILGGERKESEELSRGLTAMVHEGLWLDQKNPLPVGLPLADQRVLLFPLDGDAVFRGDPVHDQETQVVSGARVLFAWVPQTKDNLHC